MQIGDPGPPFWANKLAATWGPGPLEILAPISQEPGPLYPAHHQRPPWVYGPRADNLNGNSGPQFRRWWSSIDLPDLQKTPFGKVREAPPRDKSNLQETPSTFFVKTPNSSWELGVKLGGSFP